MNIIGNLGNQFKETFTGMSGNIKNTMTSARHLDKSLTGAVGIMEKVSNVFNITSKIFPEKGGFTNWFKGLFGKKSVPEPSDAHLIFDTISKMKEVKDKIVSA